MSFDFQFFGVDWGILCVVIDIFDYFMGCIDEVFEEYYLSDFMEVENVDSGYVEEVVLWINENLIRDFFWMICIVMGFF